MPYYIHSVLYSRYWRNWWELNFSKKDTAANNKCIDYSKLNMFYVALFLHNFPFKPRIRPLVHVGAFIIYAKNVCFIIILRLKSILLYIIYYIYIFLLLLKWRNNFKKIWYRTMQQNLFKQLIRNIQDKRKRNTK